MRCQSLRVLNFLLPQLSILFLFHVSLSESEPKLRPKSVAEVVHLFQASGVDSSRAESAPALENQDVPHHSAWINSGKFQGDIAGVEKTSLFSVHGGREISRNAVRDRNLLWLNGIIPYTIAPVFSERERQVIEGAMQSYHKKTCIRFVPRTFQNDYLHFYKDYGCYSLVGKVSGRQELSLGRGCIFHEIIVHELMHTLGFWHEQSRADRDTYINIRWDNIISGLQGQFDKIDYVYSDFLGEGYDYYSIMHYDSTAFSKNGRNTIEIDRPGMTQVIGKAMDLSPGDIRRINRLYQCSVNPQTLPSSTIPTPASSPSTVLITVPLPPVIPDHPNIINGPVESVSISSTTIPLPIEPGPVGQPLDPQPVFPVQPGPVGPVEPGPVEPEPVPVTPFEQIIEPGPVEFPTQPDLLPRESVLPADSINACVDRFLDCPFFFRYCHKQSFYPVMKLYCPKSCGHCSDVKTHPEFHSPSRQQNSAKHLL